MSFQNAFDATKKLCILVDGTTQAISVHTEHTKDIAVSTTRRLTKGSAVSVSVGQWSGATQKVDGGVTSSTNVTITRIY
jgi:hypothetical protein